MIWDLFGTVGTKSVEHTRVYLDENCINENSINKKTQLR